MMSELRFDKQVVVVTGAGAGLGKAYALFFASRGASVVVNDIGGSSKGEGENSKAADTVVSEIILAGGTAIANYDSVENGERIIQQAIDTFGKIHILINNAGILRDVSFKNMSDADWDLIMKVHVTGSYKCARAAWSHFRKSKYGRIINTTSAAGLFGNFGQVNYSAAKFSQVGFTETLAKEGYKYNIIANAIAPVAASRLTATILTPDVLENLKPEWVVPLVAVLVHHSNTKETGSIFEIGGGHVAKLRWQRSEGALMRPDDSFTPSAVLNNWSTITDFSKNSQFPTGPTDGMDLLAKANSLQANKKGAQLDFNDKVVLITGAGAGLGLAYSRLFATLGAKVVLNDIINPAPSVQEIKKLGGVAMGVQASAEEGDTLVKACIDAFGRIDIVINNAGILRDKSFANMTDELWNPVMAVHLRSCYKISKAAWPYMLKQKYGRFVNTTSTSGIYGNFGQANYAAAKAGIIGFSWALAREGAKHNIYVNTIAPNAGTALTRTIMPEQMVQALKPEYVAPLVAALCSDHLPTPTGGLYEVGSGWIAKTRWQRTRGHGFPVDATLTPEAVLKMFPKIVDFDNGRADHPGSIQDVFKSITDNMQNKLYPKKIVRGNVVDQSFLDNIETAKRAEASSSRFSYDDRDLILYNLGIGAKKTDLSLVFEGNENFHVLPTFGVIPQYFSSAPYNMKDILPNFNSMMVLHGEQYLEILQYPIPTSAELVSRHKLIEVIDKGNAAILTSSITTLDAATGNPVFYDERTLFVRGSGGFGGQSKAANRGPATAENSPPSRAPDFVQEERTTADQAVIYRLSGDRNALHVDPALSAIGGFNEPILHGLCFFGISGKHVYEKYGPFKNIKVRFTSTVLPGQTLVTEMWKEGKRVVYQVKIKETGKLCIASAAAELVEGGKPVL